MPIIIQPACTFGIVVWDKPGKTHSENPKRKRAKREATAIARKVKTVTQLTPLHRSELNKLGHFRQRFCEILASVKYKWQQLADVLSCSKGQTHTWATWFVTDWFTSDYMFSWSSEVRMPTFGTCPRCRAAGIWFASHSQPGFPLPTLRVLPWSYPHCP